MTNRVEAKDVIFGVITDAWNNNVPAIVESPTEIRYQGVKYSSLPKNDIYWIRLSIQTVSEDQETLRNNVRRFRTNGLVFVQLFSPVIDPQAVNKSDLIAELLRNVFRVRAPSDVIEFTRARINDNIASEPNWLRQNIVSEFQYTQFV